MASHSRSIDRQSQSSRGVVTELANKQRIVSPGFANPPHVVRKRMSDVPLNPKGALFCWLFLAIRRLLQMVVNTEKAEVLVLSGCGSEAIEDTIWNVISPGDVIIIAVNGEFGERMARMLERREAIVLRVGFRNGERVDPETVAAVVAANPHAKLLVLVDLESSTGIKNPVERIAAAVHTVNSDILILLDAVSTVGAEPVNMDLAGFDFVISVAGKGLEGPTGLALAWIGERGWRAIENTPPAFFCRDFREIAKAQREGLTRFTPNIPGIVGLYTALKLAEAEGWPTRFARTAMLAQEARDIFNGRGFPTATPEGMRGSGVSVFWLPDITFLDTTAEEIVKRVERLGYVIGTGRGEWQPYTVRVGHWATVSRADLVGAADALVKALHPRTPRPHRIVIPVHFGPRRPHNGRVA